VRSAEGFGCTHPSPQPPLSRGGGVILILTLILVLILVLILALILILILILILVLVRVLNLTRSFVLTVTSVGRRFAGGVEALRDVTLRLEAGDFVALLGPSGCGKSTLLRLIAGLDQPDSGVLHWDAGHAPTPGEIGFVFQDATLLPWASAEDNVYLPQRLRGVPHAQAMPEVRAALHRVGLAGFEAARPRQLSGGMRMRVSIARALVTRPRLLLMDEPFAALDEFTRHRLQADLVTLWQSIGCTVVFVTHSIYEAAFLARRIVLMTPRPGRIDQEMVSDLPHGTETRLDPAYARLVAGISRAMEAALVEQ
jgi:NitT/TauT family transport system ATP-binding protein